MEKLEPTRATLGDENLISRSKRIELDVDKPRKLTPLND